METELSFYGACVGRREWGRSKDRRRRRRRRGRRRRRRRQRS